MKQHPSRRSLLNGRNEAGFTLLEMLVVLAIMGLLSKHSAAVTVSIHFAGFDLPDLPDPFLLDLPGNRVNPEMVDIDTLDDQDRALLADAVARHHAETGSAVAYGLLADWDAAVDRFGKVMPKDFKRVLAAQAAAQRDGRDVNEAIMEAAHG